MDIVTVFCPGCDAELSVELDEGSASGRCEHCDEPIEVEDGELVYDPFADDEDDESW